jgi:hypothetical protein
VLSQVRSIMFKAGGLILATVKCRMHFPSTECSTHILINLLIVVLVLYLFHTCCVCDTDSHILRTKRGEKYAKKISDQTSTSPQNHGENLVKTK